ncbi:HspR, transcriptional repressor of DnaK operon [Microbacterium sp. 8M]|uniref:MerR family transcriptional regulator n=1 Tax=Microbacterium sp. 8M TaxID=2653153 RepID=UPI0012F14946|nr:MerR family transcriptional regulator [Microbacterium sp. 8M]VXB65392.1 HspR, transcriptional repressor of DnaK operon [Microbacterium sp. 8M]
MAERDSTTPVYGIAVAAELADMNAASLRLLEQKGLLTPARSDGGTRRYSDDDVARLQRVARLRDEGMNIAGIGRVLALEDENAGLRDELAAERAESAELRRRASEQA